MPGEQIKLKVASNIASPHTQRFFHNFYTYQVGQLTTGNVQGMMENAIGASAGKGQANMVFSDIQPHALHRFPGDKNPSLIVAVPRISKHFTNVNDCSKASLMVGHTDPQTFHWFKQLGCIPPRSIISGKAKCLTTEETFNVWDDTFVRHPHLHELARVMWEKDVSKTPDEKEAIAQREKEEDDKRMKRMMNPDWRKKIEEREQNPTPADDEPKPLYVMKADTFAVIKIEPDVQLWGTYQGPLKRVWETEWPEPDPLHKAHRRFIRTCNLSREKFVASVNMNYNMKLVNQFVFDIDKKGLWAMGRMARRSISLQM